MANFCINCGSKLEDDYNYCLNCGAKIDKSDIKQHNSLNQYSDSLKDKIINKIENKGEGKIKYSIKNELEKASIEPEKARITREKEMSSKEMAVDGTVHGGYCGLSCKHCYEEFLDGGGSIVGDFTDEGIFEYYCDLGHHVAYGSFCKYYE